MITHRFEIHVLNRSGEGYPLITRSSQFGESHGQSRFSPQADWVQDFVGILDMGLLDAEQLEEFGGYLLAGAADLGLQGLLPPAQLAHFRTALGAILSQDDGHLHLILRFDAPELEALPWELLFDGVRRVFLATDPRIALMRTLSTPEPARCLPVEGPLRALLLTASGDGLQTQAEADGIGQKMGGAPQPISPCHLHEPRPEALANALTQEPPHLFHYAGHGLFDGQSHLVVADGLGEGAVELMSSLGPDLRLAIFNACHSGDRNPQVAFGGLAHRLLNRGIPAVITVSRPVKDEVAAQFAEHFYAQLLLGSHAGDIPRAFTAARQYIQSQSPELSADFAAYRLYLRGEGHHLFPPPAQAIPRPLDQKPSPRRRIWPPLLLALAVVSLLRMVGAFETVDRLRHDAYLQQLLPRAQAKKTVIIDLGDDVARWPWHRKRLVDLYEALDQKGAKSFALDVVLSPTPMEGESLAAFQAANRRLAEGMKSGRLPGVLAVAGQLEAPAPGQKSHGMTLTSTLPAPLQGLPQGFAVVAGPKNQSTGTRWAPLLAHGLHDGDPPFYFSLAALTAAAQQQPIIETATASGPGGANLRIGDHWIETDGHYRVEVPCLAEDFHWIAAKDVLDGQRALPALRDKVAVIGRLLDPHEDRVSTLCGLKPGVAIQAGLIEGLLSGQIRRRASLSLEWVLGPVLMLMLWAIGFGRRPWVIPGAGLILALFTLAELYLEAGGLWLNLPLVEVCIWVLALLYLRRRGSPSL